MAAAATSGADADADADVATAAAPRRRPPRPSSSSLLPLPLSSPSRPLLLHLTLLAVVTLFAYRHVLTPNPPSELDATVLVRSGRLLGLLGSIGGDDDDRNDDGKGSGDDPSSLSFPEWDVLWDDKQNFIENVPITSGTINWDNIQWAWSKDAVIHGVWEPISLIIKMGLHGLARTVWDVRLEEETRLYRVINLVGHLCNVWLVYLVGLAVVASACDYRYLEERIKDEIMEEKEEEERKNALKSGRNGKGASDDGSDGGLGGDRAVSSDSGSVGDSGGGLRRRRTTRRRNDDDEREEASDDNASSVTDRRSYTVSGEDSSSRRLSIGRRPDRSSSALHASLTYLSDHRRSSSRGCLLGAAVFAVHPLQVHTIGWASCMSYVFATAFGLLSVLCWVWHRDGVRDRSRRRRSRIQRSGAPTAAAVGSATNNMGKAASAPWGMTFLTRQISAWQMLSAVLYALASLCKAPAVVLPFVLIVADVYLYSAPLSVFPNGGRILEQALAEGGETAGRDAPAVVTMKAKKGKGKGKAKRGGGPPSLPQSVSSSTLPPSNPLTATMRSIHTLVLLALRTLPSYLPHLLLLPPILYLHVSANESTSAKMRGIVPYPEKYLRAAWAVGWYVVKLVWPTDLAGAVHYEKWHVWGEGGRWDVGVAAVAVPLMTMVIIGMSPRSTWGRVAGSVWGCGLALLAPSLGIIQHARFVVADRYVYMPLAMAGPVLGALLGARCTLAMVGSSNLVGSSDDDEASAANCDVDFVLAGGPIVVPDAAHGASPPVDASWVVHSSVGRKKPPAAGAGAGGGGAPNDDERERRCARWISAASLVFACAVLCGVAVSAFVSVPLNLRNWRNKELLWTNTVRIFPRSELAHNNLVWVYQQKSSRDLDKAAHHARLSVELAPLMPKYWNNLVAILNQRNEPDEIKEFLHYRLKVLPRRDHWAKSLHLYMGRALRRMGEWEEAEKMLETAAALGEAGAKKDVEALRNRMNKEGAEIKQRELWAKQKEKRDRERENTRNDAEDTQEAREV